MKLSADRQPKTLWNKILNLQNDLAGLPNLLRKDTFETIGMEIVTITPVIPVSKQSFKCYFTYNI
jgi:hypothetical protein